MVNSADDPVLDVACSNGLKGVVAAMEDALRKRFGRLAVSYGSTWQLTETAKPATDVVIMSDAAIDALIAAGTLAAQRFDLAPGGVHRNPAPSQIDRVLAPRHQRIAHRRRAHAARSRRGVRAQVQGL